MDSPIKAEDSRYIQGNNQEFRSFEEADNFLGDYCAHCREVRVCDLRKGLCHAIGNNYPYFTKSFLRLVSKEKPNPISAEETSLPERVIACSKFNPKQLEFSFAD